MQTNKPKIKWDVEEECWTVIHGDLTVRLLGLDQVSVSGHLMRMEIFQDSITEERGILFKSDLA